jgi:hypothetical protein
MRFTTFSRFVILLVNPQEAHCDKAAEQHFEKRKHFIKNC